VSGAETLAENAGIRLWLGALVSGGLALGGLVLGGLALGARVPWEGSGDDLAAACLVDCGADVGAAGFAQPTARKIAAPATATAAARRLITPSRVRGLGQTGRPVDPSGMGPSGPPANAVLRRCPPVIPTIRADGRVDSLWR
jgi:hypothetical protein